MRQPLSTIESIAYYLGMVLPQHDKRSRRQVDKLQELVQQANWILADAIHYLQASPPLPQTIDIDECISECVSEAAKGDAVPIHLELSDSPTLVRSDPEQLRHLLRNVLYFFRQAGRPDGHTEPQGGHGVACTGMACGDGPITAIFPSMIPLISEKVGAALNAQIGMEFLASMQYEAIAAWFKLEGLPRLQAHFSKQAEEEREHAHRFIRFLLDAGRSLDLPAIPAPQCQFKSATEAVQVSLDHEFKVTESIQNLYSLAEKENDRFTQNSLQWFIEEQLEEVSSMDELLQMVKRAGDGGLLFVEHYLASQPSESGDKN